MARMLAAQAKAEKHKPPATVHPSTLATSTSEARQRILNAFVDALLEQPYERLSVSGLLRRAGVGRTTFYAQFRDKEELFELSVRNLGQGISQAALNEPGPWGFLRPLLRHMDSHRDIYCGFIGRESAPVLERHLQRLLSRLLTEDLARRGLAAPDPVRQAAMVGALWALLVAWIERRIALGPEPLAREAALVLEALAPR
jgi:AcrR family transcriptional regulator